MSAGLWTAYETAKMVHAAQGQRAEKRGIARDNRSLGRYKQMRMHIAKREQQVKLLESIEQQIAHPTRGRFDRLCPECSKAFIMIQAGPVEIETCLPCGSFWFDEGELKAITRRSKDVPGDTAPGQASQYNCPVCHDNMTEYPFIAGQDLRVDICPNHHGIYLERDELERAIDASLALKLKPDKDGQH
jgi:Zn-finger nucleic acid-binding protein